MKNFAVFAGLGLIAATATTAIVASASGPIESARPGARIVWPSGDGQKLSIIGKSFDPAITIDASRASFSAILIRDSRGVYIKGGTVIGPGGRSYGVHVDRSRDIGIEGMTITGAHRGMVINKSTDITLRNNQLVGLISDGINLALSSRILVEGNSCKGFRHNPAIYAPDGKMIRDGDHPDFIQAWSRPEAPPVHDVRIIGNRAEGPMQGIFFGNHIRNGVDDGGFDRITIANNVIHVSFPRGITLGSGRNSVVRDNRISTVSGSVLPKPPHRTVTANLWVTKAVNVLVCGNMVVGARSAVGLKPCPR